MTIKTSAICLHKILLEKYKNIQSVGIGDNTIYVYTTTMPITEQFSLIEYDGFKVSWNYCGVIVAEGAI